MGSLQSDGFENMHKEALLMYSSAVTHSGLCKVKKKIFILPLQFINVPRMFSEQATQICLFCKAVVVHLLDGYICMNYLLSVCLFSWRYNPMWLYFHSPVAGFSLLVFEVS
jgi:hypothetical protein